MKKIFVFAVTMLLAASLSFAQGTTGSGDSSTGKKGTTQKSKKGHKGGKKSKKNSGGTTTPAPK